MTIATVVIHAVAPGAYEYTLAIFRCSSCNGSSLYKITIKVPIRIFFPKIYPFLGQIKLSPLFRQTLVWIRTALVHRKLWLN